MNITEQMEDAGRAALVDDGWDSVMVGEIDVAVIFSAMVDENKSFSVIAGKFDGYDRNCKYAADFATLDDAIKAYDEMAGYPWRYIQYAGRTIDVFPIDFKPFE